MAFGVFIHRTDSLYNDVPAERYQFPSQYLSRVSSCVGDWIVYYEPSKVKNSKGYYAVAKLEKIIPDPTTAKMYLALIEPGSYLDFANFVPFNGPQGIVEQGVLNKNGKVSGRAQSAVRLLSGADFRRITELGLAFEESFLPREDNDSDIVVHEMQDPYGSETDRKWIQYFSKRPVRDQSFRKRVVTAYDSRCAITGWKLINGGGRAEVEAAHIRPVEKQGPDMINNGLALSGTVHWMFDRGLITLSDELDIIVSRQANDPSAIHALINKNGKANLPTRASDRPHPIFLEWHRENCFKR